MLPIYRDITMRKTIMAALLAGLFSTLPAFAQQAPVGASITSSKPGQATMAETVKASAIITAIDKATRTLTLKGAKGESFDVVAGAEVKNFDQIKVGDEVKVAYLQALSMELKKAGGATGVKESTGEARAKAGEKPAGVIGREVTVMADVIDVNPTAKTITLKGPKGKVVELDVKNPEHFKVVKKGDQVEVVYTEALAVSVEAAPKAAPKAEPKKDAAKK